MGMHQRQQCVAIKRVQILERSAIHERSMPSAEYGCIHKTRINTGESRWSSHGDFRRPRPLHSSPIDPFQKHRELCATEPHASTVRLRPDESTTLKALGKQAKTIAIPPQQFYDVASAPAKHEDVSGEWLLLKHGLH